MTQKILKKKGRLYRRKEECSFMKGVNYITLHYAYTVKLYDISKQKNGLAVNLFSVKHIYIFFFWGGGI